MTVPERSVSLEELKKLKLLGYLFFSEVALG
jgi:hypothetical protein